MIIYFVLPQYQPFNWIDKPTRENAYNLKMEFYVYEKPLVFFLVKYFNFETGHIVF